MEVGLSWNLRVVIDSLMLTDLDMHALTRESHEVFVGLIIIKGLPIEVDVVVPNRVMLSTDIPHSGQLNITTSTLSSPL